MERRALEAALEDVVSQGTQGWPHRSAQPDLATALVVGPTFRREGERVIGPGFSFEAPASWAVSPRAPQNPLLVFETRAPDGFDVSVIMTPSNNGDHNFSNDYVNTIRNAGTITRDTTVQVGTYEAREIELTRQDGMLTMQRVTSVGGIGLVVMCVGSPAIAQLHRAECEHALRTFAPTAELVSDGHR